MWVNEMRYELQEIFRIGNLVDGADFDGNDPDKECVICLSEPRDTTVLPCRDKCLRSEYSGTVRLMLMPHGFEDFHKEDVKDKLFFISPRIQYCFSAEEIFKDEQAEVMETDAKPEVVLRMPMK
ncbi:hypothetical protein Tco_1420870 [Tanacetum coccineum]